MEGVDEVEDGDDGEFESCLGGNECEYILSSRCKFK